MIFVEKLRWKKLQAKSYVLCVLVRIYLHIYTHTLYVHMFIEYFWQDIQEISSIDCLWGEDQRDWMGEDSPFILLYFVVNHNVCSTCLKHFNKDYTDFLKI